MSRWRWRFEIARAQRIFNNNFISCHITLSIVPSKWEVPMRSSSPSVLFNNTESTRPAAMYECTFKFWYLYLILFSLFRAKTQEVSFKITLASDSRLPYKMYSWNYLVQLSAIDIFIFDILQPQGQRESPFHRRHSVRCWGGAIKFSI